MRSIPVIVDYELRLDGNLVGHDLANQIFDDLTIYNTAKEVAKRMDRWGWQELPDHFLLADLDGDTVVMPRGYALRLKQRLREQGIRVQWVDRRRWTEGGPFPTTGTNGRFRPHQVKAIRKIIKHHQGMYESPTGGGKTVSCIGFIIAKQPHQTLILVDKLDLLNQWRKELAHWLGVSIDSIGQIGDGKWKEGARITVATVQTLRKRKPKDSWFDHWDCVILDECHHVTAETIRDILYQFSAKYRFGVSATTDRKDDKFGFALAVLGEVFHQDDEEALRDAGVLVRPHVKVVKTRFEHDYWPDHQSDEEDECQVPKCPFSGKRPHFHRNNYHAVKTALVNDEHRNALVIGHVMREISKGDHHHLIITNEIKHLELLRERFGVHPVFVRPVPVFTLTGQIKGRERAEIVAAIERVPAAVIFATVAKEGLDIPQIDRIYLPFPESNPKSTQQKIGRGTRIHEGKQDSIVFDFFDINVSVFRKQFRNRRFQCYDQLGMEVDLG